MEKHLKLLGLRVQDKVTGFNGIVESICFDLYGCIQASVRPGKLGKDGTVQEGRWFDISRLKPLSDNPVMDQPNFMTGPQAEGNQGPAEKPAIGRW